jgi:hypothetical protein
LVLNMHKMKIRCTTTFDCTRTGVTGHYRVSQLPFVDRSGKLISTQQEWACSRNQQRNYETLLQIFGLKTQPLDITDPVKNSQSQWEFEFCVETPAVFLLADNSDPLASLKRDCEKVPMIADVGNISQPLSVLTVDQNIWFEVINTPTEN